VLSNEFMHVSGTGYSKGVLDTLDVTDERKIESYFKKNSPEIIIYAAGEADPAEALKNPERAYRLNAEAVRLIAKHFDKRFFYISTDYVFDGENPPYGPNSHPNPGTTYGLTKLAGEKATQESFAQYVILRVSKMFGYNDKHDKKTFISEVVAKLRAQEDIFADNQQIRYPVLIDDVADTIVRLINNDAEGIFHLNGAEGLTKYEWACRVADVFAEDLGMSPVDALRHIKIRETETPDSSTKPNNSKLLNSDSIHSLEEGMRAMKAKMGKDGLLADGGDKVKTYPLDERLRLIQALSIKSPSKIFFLVMDGVGGLQKDKAGTELEKAKHPIMDKLAQWASVALSTIVMPGITPGSGPGHFAIFGYDPMRHSLGRGTLDAMGAGIELLPGDVVARVNFATAKDGLIVDRRAGRVSTEESQQVAEQFLSGIKIGDTEVIVKVTKEHRGVLILRGGQDLSAKLTDSDPGKENQPARDVEAKSPEAEVTAALVRSAVEEMNKRLSGQPKVNFVLLRSWDELVKLPSFAEVYKLNAAAVATYPAYIGIARSLGMTILPVKGEKTISDQIEAVRENLDKHDFFFIHFKYTDKAGEDGDFDKKVHYIEEVDNVLPELLKLMNVERGDALVITGDHSTPAVMKAHSFHAVPALICSKFSRIDMAVKRFTESFAKNGSLGFINARDIMPLAMGHAGKLDKLDGPIDVDAKDGGQAFKNFIDNLASAFYFPDTEKQMRGIDKFWIITTVVSIFVFYWLTTISKGIGWVLGFTVAWNLAIFIRSFVVDQYYYKRWHVRQWGMSNFRYPKFAGTMCTSLNKMMSLNLIDIPLTVGLIALLPGTYFGLPGAFLAIGLRTMIMLVISTYLSYKLRGLNYPKSAQRAEIRKNIILSLGSTIVGSVFLGGSGLEFIALYSIVYKIASEIWGGKIDLQGPRTPNVFVRLDDFAEKYNGSFPAPKEIRINNSNVLPTAVSKKVENILNLNKDYLEVSYDINVDNPETIQPWLDKMERSLDFLVGTRFDTNNPSHLKALRNFIEKSMKELEIYPEVWSLDEKRLEENILRDSPKELEEFSRQMPSFHRHVIKNDTLRRLVTYGSVFEGNVQFDKERANAFEEENPALVSIFREPQFIDPGFWKKLRADDFKKQPIEIFVAQKEYFKEVGREDLLDKLEKPVIRDRLTGQIIVIPQENRNPFELLLEIMERVFWLKFNSDVIESLINKKKDADFGKAFIDDYLAGCWRHSPVWSCKKIMGGFIAKEILNSVGKMGLSPSIDRKEIVRMFGADDSWKGFFEGSGDPERNVLVFNSAWKDLVNNKENVIRIKYLPLFDKWEEFQAFRDLLKDCGNYSLIPALDGRIGLPLKGFVSFIYAKEAMRIAYEKELAESGIDQERADSVIEEMVWKIIVKEAAAGRIDYAFFNPSLNELKITFSAGKIKINGSAARDKNSKDGGKKFTELRQGLSTYQGLRGQFGARAPPRGYSVFSISAVLAALNLTHISVLGISYRFFLNSLSYTGFNDDIVCFNLLPPFLKVFILTISVAGPVLIFMKVYFARGQKIQEKDKKDGGIKVIDLAGIVESGKSEVDFSRKDGGKLSAQVERLDIAIRKKIGENSMDSPACVMHNGVPKAAECIKDSRRFKIVIDYAIKLIEEDAEFKNVFVFLYYGVPFVCSFTEGGSFRKYIHALKRMSARLSCQGITLKETIESAAAWAAAPENSRQITSPEEFERLLTQHDPVIKKQHGDKDTLEYLVDAYSQVGKYDGGSSKLSEWVAVALRGGFEFLLAYYLMVPIIWWGTSLTEEHRLHLAIVLTVLIGLLEVYRHRDALFGLRVNIKQEESVLSYLQMPELTYKDNIGKYRSMLIQKIKNVPQDIRGRKMINVWLPRKFAEVEYRDGMGKVFDYEYVNLATGKQIVVTMSRGQVIGLQGVPSEEITLEELLHRYELFSRGNPESWRDGGRPQEEPADSMINMIIYNSRTSRKEGLGTAEIMLLDESERFVARVKAVPITNPRIRTDKLERYNYEGIIFVELREIGKGLFNTLDNYAIKNTLVRTNLFGLISGKLSSEDKEKDVFGWLRRRRVKYVIDGAFVNFDQQGKMVLSDYPLAEYKSKYINQYLLLDIYGLAVQEAIGDRELKPIKWLTFFNPAVWSSKQDYYEPDSFGVMQFLGIRPFIPNKILWDFSRRNDWITKEHWWLVIVSPSGTILKTNSAYGRWLKKIAEKNELDGGEENRREAALRSEKDFNCLQKRIIRLLFSNDPLKYQGDLGLIKFALQYNILPGAMYEILGRENNPNKKSDGFKKFNWVRTRVAGQKENYRKNQGLFWLSLETKLSPHLLYIIFGSEQNEFEWTEPEFKDPNINGYEDILIGLDQKNSAVKNRLFEEDLGDKKAVTSTVAGDPAFPPTSLKKDGGNSDKTELAQMWRWLRAVETEYPGATKRAIKTKVLWLNQMSGQKKDEARKEFVSRVGSIKVAKYLVVLERIRGYAQEVLAPDKTVAIPEISYIPIPPAKIRRRVIDELIEKVIRISKKNAELLSDPAAQETRWDEILDPLMEIKRNVFKAINRNLEKNNLPGIADPGHQFIVACILFLARNNKITTKYKIDQFTASTLGEMFELYKKTIAKQSYKGGQYNKEENDDKEKLEKEIFSKKVPVAELSRRFEVFYALRKEGTEINPAIRVSIASDFRISNLIYRHARKEKDSQGETFTQWQAAALASSASPVDSCYYAIKLLEKGLSRNAAVKLATSSNLEEAKEICKPGFDREKRYGSGEKIGKLAQVVRERITMTNETFPDCIFSKGAAKAAECLRNEQRSLWNVFDYAIELAVSQVQFEHSLIFMTSGVALIRKYAGRENFAKYLHVLARMTIRLDRQELSILRIIEESEKRKGLEEIDSPEDFELFLIERDLEIKHEKLDLDWQRTYLLEYERSSRASVGNYAKLTNGERSNPDGGKFSPEGEITGLVDKQEIVLKDYGQYDPVAVKKLILDALDILAYDKVWGRVHDIRNPINFEFEFLKNAPAIDRVKVMQLPLFALEDKFVLATIIRSKLDRARCLRENSRAVEKEVLFGNINFFLRLPQKRKTEILARLSGSGYAFVAAFKKLELAMRNDDAAQVFALLYGEDLNRFYPNQKFISDSYRSIIQEFKGVNVPEGVVVGLMLGLVYTHNRRVGGRELAYRLKDLFSGIRAIPLWSGIIYKADMGVLITKLDGILAKGILGIKFGDEKARGVHITAVCDNILRLNQISKRINRCQQENQCISLVKGIFGAKSLLYFMTFYLGELVTGLIGKDAETEIVLISREGTKEVDFVSSHGKSKAISNTMAEAKFSTSFSALYKQIVGLQKQVSVFGLILDAHAKADTELTEEDYKLRRVKNVVAFAENDHSGLVKVIRSYIEKNKNNFEKKTLDFLAMPLPWKGFAVRFSLKEFEELLCQEAMLAGCSAQCRELSPFSREEIKNSLRDIFKKMEKVYKGVDFDIYITVSNPDLGPNPFDRGYLDKTDQGEFKNGNRKVVDFKRDLGQNNRYKDGGNIDHFAPSGRETQKDSVLPSVAGGGRKSLPGGAFYFKAAKDGGEKEYKEGCIVSTRISLIRNLGRQGNYEAVAYLLKILNDKNENPFARSVSAEALGKIGDQRAVGTLIQGLKEINPDPFKQPRRNFSYEHIRFRSAEALGRLKAENALNDLILALSDESSRVRKYAVEALGELQNKEGLTPLIALLKDEDAAVRRSAARVLGAKSRDYRAATALREASLQDTVSSVRTTAAEALKNMFQELIKKLQCGCGEPSMKAAEVLGDIGDPRAIKYLIETLKKQEGLGIIQAITGELIKIGAQSYDPLKSVSEDPAVHLNVREEAAKALKMIREAGEKSEKDGGARLISRQDLQKTAIYRILLSISSGERSLKAITEDTGFSDVKAKIRELKEFGLVIHVKNKGYKLAGKTNAKNAFRFLEQKLKEAGKLQLEDDLIPLITEIMDENPGAGAKTIKRLLKKRNGNIKISARRISRDFQPIIAGHTPTDQDIEAAVLTTGNTGRGAQKFLALAGKPIGDTTFAQRIEVIKENSAAVQEMLKSKNLPLSLVYKILQEEKGEVNSACRRLREKGFKVTRDFKFWERLAAFEKFLSRFGLNDLQKQQAMEVILKVVDNRLYTFRSEPNNRRTFKVLLAKGIFEKVDTKNYALGETVEKELLSIKLIPQSGASRLFQKAWAGIKDEQERVILAIVAYRAKGKFSISSIQKLGKLPWAILDGNHYFFNGLNLTLNKCERKLMFKNGAGVYSLDQDFKNFIKRKIPDPLIELDPLVEKACLSEHNIPDNPGADQKPKTIIDAFLTILLRTIKDKNSKGDNIDLDDQDRVSEIIQDITRFEVKNLLGRASYNRVNVVKGEILEVNRKGNLREYILKRKIDIGLDPSADGGAARHLEYELFTRQEFRESPLFKVAESINSGMRFRHKIVKTLEENKFHIRTVDLQLTRLIDLGLVEFKVKNEVRKYSLTSNYADEQELEDKLIETLRERESKKVPIWENIRLEVYRLFKQDRMKQGKQIGKPAGAYQQRLPPLRALFKLLEMTNGTISIVCLICQRYGYHIDRDAKVIKEASLLPEYLSQKGIERKYISIAAEIILDAIDNEKIIIYTSKYAAATLSHLQAKGLFCRLGRNYYYFGKDVESYLYERRLMKKKRDTEKLLECLRLIDQGFNSRQIQNRLGLSSGVLSVRFYGELREIGFIESDGSGKIRLTGQGKKFAELRKAMTLSPRKIKAKESRARRNKAVVKMLPGVEENIPKELEEIERQDIEALVKRENKELAKAAVEKPDFVVDDRLLKYFKSRGFDFKSVYALRIYFYRQFGTEFVLDRENNNHHKNNLGVMKLKELLLLEDLDTEKTWENQVKGKFRLRREDFDAMVKLFYQSKRNVLFIRGKEYRKLEEKINEEQLKEAWSKFLLNPNEIRILSIIASSGLEIFVSGQLGKEASEIVAQEGYALLSVLSSKLILDGFPLLKKFNRGG
ncbi:MAG: 2,3-bisphosphoglycerate-independent phosphoglycerate mutase, partial [Candidatus Omnitrophica bacterium]|nr:2,3-bisphosphoglycerate-independent phosphoglycerate mutase [Candidatus Omnitrophota bacterium]